VTLLVESSAVLSLVLGESTAPGVLSILKGADIVASSVLTLVECDRVLSRIEAMSYTDLVQMKARRDNLAELVANWTIVPLDEPVLARARQRFPQEPVRTLDALHLATAVTLREWPGDIALLSLDRRVRENALALGFEVLPAIVSAVK